MPSSFIKDPDATLDYTVEWGEWLGDGDTVSTATWTVPDDLTAETGHRDDVGDHPSPAAPPGRPTP